MSFLRSLTLFFPAFWFKGRPVGQRAILGPLFLMKLEVTVLKICGFSCVTRSASYIITRTLYIVGNG